MREIFHLLYTSRSLEKVTSNHLQSILTSARAHNLADELTGFLIVRNRFFLQILEGEEAKVRACFERIRNDPRHSDILVHVEVESAARLTPSWSMGYVPWNDQMATSKSLIEIFENAERGVVQEKMDSLITMLQSFAKEARNVA